VLQTSVYEPTLTEEPAAPSRAAPTNSVKPRFASFVGILPGPKTGMTYSTDHIVSRLRRLCALREYDLGTGFSENPKTWQRRKMLGSLNSAFAIMRWSRRNNEAIYISLNSTSGLIYNAIQLLAARIRGYRCYVHHHGTHYIDQADWRMQLLLWAASKKTVHIMACQQMQDDFERVYHRKIRSAIVPPIVVRCSSTEHRETFESFNQSSQGFCLGHLSNLSRDKGLIEVIETFERVLQSFPATRLIVAGPCHSSSDQKIIDEAAHKHPDRVEYRGAVYGQDKVDFFNQIHAFVYPTKSDSWGIVINEALASATPVISVRLSCIPCLVGNGGTVIDINKDFVDDASQQIIDWIRDDEAYADARRHAWHRARQIEFQTECAMQAMVEEIAGSSSQI
jgi:glycosyltransferase involved in cell wall biosynthesis